ncbi:MAG: hypothetical protein V4641_12990 [Pseudomonadota bacterium]
MRHSTKESALLIALLYKRGGNPRARFSETTLRKLSGRLKLRTAFIFDLKNELDDLGYAFFEIDRGFALLPLSALDGAYPLTANKLLPEYVEALLKGQAIDFRAVEKELGLDNEEEEPDVPE